MGQEQAAKMAIVGAMLIAAVGAIVVWRETDRQRYVMEACLKSHSAAECKELR
jgi:hypothetical protein